MRRSYIPVSGAVSSTWLPTRAAWPLQALAGVDNWLDCGVILEGVLTGSAEERDDLWDD
jgi:hypothetical protein